MTTHVLLIAATTHALPIAVNAVLPGRRGTRGLWGRRVFREIPAVLVRKETKEIPALWARRVFQELPEQEGQEAIPDLSDLPAIPGQEVMQAQEVTQGRRAFRESRGFAVISVQKAIPAVKARRVKSDRKGQRDLPDLQDQSDRRVKSDRRGQEAFRGLPDLQDLPALWVRKA